MREGGVYPGTWYTLSPKRTSFSRGSSITTRVDSNSLPGEVLDWTLSGDEIDINDLDLSSGGGLSGKTEITSNGYSSIQHTFKPDNQTSTDTEITIDLFRENTNQKLATTSFQLVATPAEAEPNKTIIDEIEGSTLVLHISRTFPLQCFGQMPHVSGIKNALCFR